MLLPPPFRAFSERIYQMKIGKYPVKRSYRIARLIADIFTAGLLVLIGSGVAAFFADYEAQLDLLRIGQDNVQNIVDNYDSTILWRQWLILIFPAIALGIVAAYLVLTLKSHSFKKYSINKRNAQAVYDEYAFCVSLCKIPLLIILYDAMCGIYDILLPFKMYGFALFSWSDLLYVLIIAIIIRWTMHRLEAITAAKPAEDSSTIKVKAVQSNNTVQEPASAEDDKEET